MTVLLFILTCILCSLSLSLLLLLLLLLFLLSLSLSLSLSRETVGFLDVAAPREISLPLFKTLANLSFFLSRLQGAMIVECKLD